MTHLLVFRHEVFVVLGLDTLAAQDLSLHRPLLRVRRPRSDPLAREGPSRRHAR